MQFIGELYSELHFNRNLYNRDWVFLVQTVKHRFIN